MSKRTLQRRRPKSAPTKIVLGANPLTNELFARVDLGIDGRAGRWLCANPNCTKILAEKIGRDRVQLDGFVWSQKERLYLEPKELREPQFWPTARAHDLQNFANRFQESPQLRRSCNQRWKAKLANRDSKHGGDALNQLQSQIEVEQLPVPVRCPFCKTRSILSNTRPKTPPQLNNATGQSGAPFE